MSEYKVRASSWSTLFDCAHKYEAIALLGMKSPGSPRSHLGSAIHHGTAAYDAGRINGDLISPAEAADEFISYLKNPQEDIDWSADDLTMNDAATVGIQLVNKYCKEVSHKFDFESVEMTTVPLSIDIGDGVTVVLTGTLDRCRVKKGSKGRGIADIKTGKTVVQGGKANIKGFVAQIGSYELLYEHSTGNKITEDGTIIGMKTSGRPEIALGDVPRAKELLLGTDEYPGLIEHAGVFFKTGSFHPNPNSNLCAPRYCVRWNTCRYKSDK